MVCRLAKARYVAALKWINVDRTHKFIRRYAVTDTSVHDSQMLNEVLDPANTASDVWADSAYRSKETESKLAVRGLKSRIHRKATRAKPLTDREKQANKTRSRVRSRVEHIFGDQQNATGGKLISCIGLARATARIELKNLAKNMRRLVQLERPAVTEAIAAAPGEAASAGGLCRKFASKAPKTSGWWHGENQTSLERFNRPVSGRHSRAPD